MNVTFYQCTCDNRYVNKRPYLTVHATISNAVLYEGCSIIEPVIRITWAGGVPGVNYCFIEEFNRWYYVTNSEALEGNSVKYYLRCDVLMTYGGTILNTAQTVIRSESIGHPTLIPDNNLTTNPAREMKVIKFEGGIFNLNSATLNSPNFIINVAGGGGYNPD